ncbi:secretory phospholipase A2 receptor-like [Diprion similis]|uniref:secretory phospholipase A2 receptor-like n=1 Tax=Diprion similis TaxID=362088 RepID=UPI001EF81E23|nr:secretory phospholipase A2 receptor-like [Diprion similis]
MASTFKSLSLLQHAEYLFVFLMVTCSLTNVESSNTGYIPFGDGSTLYKFHTESMNWYEARSMCDLEGGHLAMIDTLDKLNFIYEIRVGHWWVWTGIHRAGSGSPWYSVGHESPGQELTHLPWAPIRLLPIFPNSNCVATTGLDMGINRGLAHYGCLHRKPFVCEKHIESDKLDIDRRFKTDPE